MLNNLSRRQQRFIAVVLLLVALSLAYALLIYGWFNAPLRSIETEMDSLRDSRQHYLSVLAQRQLLERQLAAAQSQPENTEALLPGPDIGAATAQLLGLVNIQVQDMATVGQGCSVTNRMPINVSDVGNYIPVRASFNLNCGIEPLANVLLRIENARPLLFVDTLSIHSNDGQAADANSKQLVVQLMVSGYLRSTAQSGAQP